MKFAVHTLTSAPEPSRRLLQAAAARYGFVPNLFGVLAESPAALGAYLGIADALNRTRLTPAEREIVTIAVSVENGCTYCVAAHSAVARMVHLPEEAIVAVRAGGRVADPKLEALRGFATAVVATRGRPGAEELRSFQAAGYDAGHVLDVLAIVAMKTLSNYTNHIAETPLDEAFAPQRWQPSAAA